MKNQGKLILPIITLLTLSSCSSWVESGRRMIGGDAPRATTKTGAKWVSKSQYDDLMTKYKGISDKYEKLKESKLSKSDALSSISIAGQSGVQTSTVDVFGDGGLASKAINTTAVKQVTIPNSGPGKEIQVFKKAVSLKEANRQDEALRIFQHLEKSPTKQIQVRARIQIAQIYYQQNNFDLSLQVFEQVINHNSFSSYVLDALKGATLCSQKLGLEDKRLRYNSILKDFFGMQG